MSKKELIIGAIQSFTTIDFPGKLSAILFCQGCSFNCVYCHNHELREIHKNSKHSWDEIKQFLKERKNFLEAVVFCGGEPTIHPEIIDYMKKIKKLGYLVGLHSAGINLIVFEKALKLANWIGFDIKAPFDERYDKITQRINSWKNPEQSLKLLINSGVDYQLRTTIDPKLLSEKDIQDIKDYLQENYGLQNKLVLQQARY